MTQDSFNLWYVRTITIAYDLDRFTKFIYSTYTVDPSRHLIPITSTYTATLIGFAG